MFDTVRQDARYAVRSLRRAPGFAIVAIGSLAVGVGFAVFIYSFVQQALAMTTVPAARTVRLVDVFTNQPNGTPYGTSSFPDIEDIRQRAHAFDQLVAYSPYAAALNVDGVTRIAFGEIVTGNYFQVLGVGTTVGRSLQPSDDQPGAPRVVVVSEGLWRRQFGSSPLAIGHVLRIRGQPYTVIGVAARRYTGAAFVPVDFWTPMTWAEDADPVGISDTVPSPGRSRLEQRGSRWLFVKGRLAAGQTVDSARSALQALMTQLASEYPTTNAKRQFTALNTQDVRIHPVVDFAITPINAALGVIVLLVLVVACANVSGLLLARGANRQREIAIRFAMGASRRRVVRQLLTESLLVAGVGSASAMGMLWTLATIGRDISAHVNAPFTVEPRIGTPAVWFGVAVAIAAGIAAGLAPALRATDRGRLTTLRAPSSMAAGGRQWSLRDGLIVIQTAAAFVLLVVAGLLTRSALVSQRVDLGFRTEGVVSISTETSVLGYDVVKATRFYDQALTRIRAIPGVHFVALAARKPLDISYTNETFFTSDRVSPADAGEVSYATTVSPEYFDLFGVDMVEGRHFRLSDTTTSPRVAIVTQAFAKKYFPGGSAVGRHFRTRTADGPDYEIVGVCADYKVATPGEPPTPYMHYAVSQDPSTQWQILVRAAPGTAVPVDRIRHELGLLDSGLLIDVHSMTSNVTRVLLPIEASAVGLSIVGLATILFAAIGLYAVVSFMVARRTQEFGVRMAVGASPFQVLSFVVRHGLAVGAIGIGLGAVAAAVAAAVLTRTLYGVGAADPLTWLAALVIVFSISLVAHGVPARRAASVNPAIALRAE